MKVRKPGRLFFLIRNENKYFTQKKAKKACLRHVPLISFIKMQHCINFTRIRAIFMDIIFDLSNIKNIAQDFLNNTASYTVIAFSGELGAGKTTLISALCKELAVEGNVSSPTFSIIQEYETKNKGIIYHIDLYRIRSKEEAIEAGIEDCLYSGERCFVEWPEKAPSLFPERTVFARLQVVSANTRKLIVKLP